MRQVLVTLLLLQFGLNGQAQPQWQELFNGKDLNGWERVGNIDAKVKDGILTLENNTVEGSNWLVSEKSFINFEIEAEYLLPPPGNSGLFIRYYAPQGGHPSVLGYEIELANWPDNPYPSGSILGIARSKWPDKIEPDGWNTLRIRAEGDYLRVWINEEQVSQIYDRSNLYGQVGLLGPTGKGQIVSWRNIRIRELPQTFYLGTPIDNLLRRSTVREKQPLFDGKSLDGWTPVGDGNWVVVDGAIIGDSGPNGTGYLVSNQAYQNFYFRCKFRIKEAQNSGIFIRKDTTVTEVSLDNGLEINVYDPGDNLWGWPTGSIVRYGRAPADIMDTDDWNVMEIFALEDHICIYVNGAKTAEAHIPNRLVRPGYICLQAGQQVAKPEGGQSQVHYKAITIKNMDGVPLSGY